MSALALKVLLLFLLKLASTVEPNKIERRGHIEIEKRIVGGYDADVGAAQLLVSLVLKDKTRFQSQGVLYKENFVLTTQHCVHGLRPKDIRIYFGSNCIHGNWDSIKVQKIYRHRLFDSRTYSHNIAILFLNCIGIPSYEFGKNFTLYENSSLEIGKFLKIFGWGSLEYDGPYPDSLQSAQLTSTSRKECRRKYNNVNIKIDHTMVCAGAKAKGACQSDEGGPVVLFESLNSDNQQPILVGLVSF